MIKTYGMANKDFPYLTAAVDQNGKKVIINSSKKMNDYMSPSQMLEVALAGCFTMTLKGVMYTHQQPYNDVHVTVNMYVEKEETTFDIEADIDANISEELKQQYIQEAYSKCYVNGILNKPIHTNLK